MKFSLMNKYEAKVLKLLSITSFGELKTRAIKKPGANRDQNIYKILYKLFSI